MLVEWQQRAGGRSAWISVGDFDRGPHFQCDYFGDMSEGPRHKSDFSAEPPEWVVSNLGLLP